MNRVASFLLLSALITCSIARGMCAEIEGYTDLSGSFAEKKVQELVKLGILPKGTHSKFLPGATLTRGDFVTWLVRSNNVLQPKHQIRLAEPGTAPSFKDMSGKEPSFPYVQGMKDAGWSIGFEDGTFRPKAAITREQMIGIKACLDADKDLTKTYYSEVKNWGDWQSIDKRYFGPMCYEAMFTNNGNWQRVFGATKVCQPQKAVTRAEAAVCVWQVDGTLPKNPENFRK